MECFPMSAGSMPVMKAMPKQAGRHRDLPENIIFP